MLYVSAVVLGKSGEDEMNVLKKWAVFTWPPEGDALLLMRLADAVVAIAVHIVTCVSVVQVDICRAVGAGASAELGEVT